MASALIPVINAELFVVFLGTVATGQMLHVLVLVSTVSHMVGKAILYYAGRAADRLPPGWLKTKVEKARPRTGGHRTVGGALVFTSSLVGFPPFYVVTVASGREWLAWSMLTLRWSSSSPTAPDPTRSAPPSMLGISPPSRAFATRVDCTR
jgi:membrane protein YqaA with SNARE-associated domain